jgi:hypothetical protein
VIFDHAVSAVIIRDGEPFATCETCNFPVRRDRRPEVDWSHLDDPDSEPLWLDL